MKHEATWYKAMLGRIYPVTVIAGTENYLTLAEAPSRREKIRGAEISYHQTTEAAHAWLLQKAEHRLGVAKSEYEHAAHALLVLKDNNPNPCPTPKLAKA